MQTQISNSPTAESRSGRISPPATALIAAAILLPPLALFLLGGVSRDFWIAVALTCLGYLPGVAFALFASLRRPLVPGAA